MTNIAIENAPDGIWEKTSRDTIQEFLKTQAINSRASVNVFFVSKRKMRSLNLKYRKIDSVTDVLSFPIWQGKKDIPSAGKISLGDVFICPEETDFTNLSFIVRHSLNHLIGKHHEV